MTFNTKTLTIAAVLYFAIFLFAHHTATNSPQQLFRGVADLSASVSPTQRQLSTTILYAPADSTIDRITPDRFVTPLAVVDVVQKIRKDANYSVTLDDISDYERRFGTIPAGAVVAFSSGAERKPVHVSPDVIDFLLRGRDIYGVSFDAALNPAATDMALRNGAYLLANTSDIEAVPESGAILIVAPIKAAGVHSAPARVFALLRAK